MTSQELRKKFLNFFESKGHTITPSSSLVPENDASVLLTTAGMQQFKPYYTGALNPLKDNHLSSGKPLGSTNVVSVQKCFRTSDIEEVGDITHLTFFEMLGNFSFGGYGKKEAIEYAYEFITKILKLKIDYVSVFEGEANVPADTESEEIWQQVDPSLKIIKAGRADNFWGPTGDQGPCGPTTEIYIEGVEIWNIVFNEFYQNNDKTLTKLDTLGIDTGMGLERLASVVQKVPTIFDTNLFAPMMNVLPNALEMREKRIISDHLRAICFLVSDGVTPSNKGAGNILQRLMRRVMLYEKNLLINAIAFIVAKYQDFYETLNEKIILLEFENEFDKFVNETLARGVPIANGEFDKIVVATINGQVMNKTLMSDVVFNLYQTHGLPFESIKELASKKGLEVDEVEFYRRYEEHRKLSQTASAGMFKGGLVDHEAQTIKHHTAHHLLLAALRQVLGNHVLQRGSNVSSERLRIDFSHPEKVNAEQLKQVEEIVNQVIKDDLEVKKEEMPKAEAEKLGALAEFGAKYGDTVSVYTIFNKDGSVFSREFCGGPHVTHTGELGSFKVIKEEAVAAGIRRIKAKVG